jgi:SSS family transporter
MNESLTVEYTVIGLYMAFMLVAGVVFRRFVRSFSDYFRSGSRATWWLVGSSVFMASFSAWTFTGAAGVAYLSGITVAVIFLSNTIGYITNFAVTAPWFRQLRSTTYPEVIRDRFNTPTQQFYVWLGIIPGTMSASLTLLGVAVFTSAVLGFDVTTVVVLLGVVVLFYATIGGSWSVMATDFLQTLILMPVACLVTFLSLKSIGGFSGLFSAIHEQGLDDHLRLIDATPGSEFSIGWAAAMLIYVLLSYNSMGASAKFFACKDGRDARKASAMAAVLMLVGAFLWFIPPIVARLQFSHLVDAQQIAKPAEAAYAIISMQLLPTGLAGLVVVAMFTATMSSLDSHLNQAAAIITQDFYKPFFKPKATDKEMFLVGQIASVVIGLVIIAFAVYFSKQGQRGLFEYMLLFGSLLGTPMIVPMFLAIFVRNAPVWSAMFSVVCAFIVSFFAYRLKWNYEQRILWIGLTGATGFLSTIPFWSTSTVTYREKVNAFFKKMHTPVDFEKEIGGATDTRQLKIIGWFALAIGLFISLLSLLPNPTAGKIQIVCLAGSIAGLGGLMLIAARILDRKNAALARESVDHASPAENPVD